MEQHAKDTIDGERGAGVGVELSGQHCSFSVSPSEATGKNRQNEGDAFPFSPNRTTRTRSTGRRPTTSRRATPSRLLRLAQERRGKEAENENAREPDQQYGHLL